MDLTKKKLSKIIKNKKQSRRKMNHAKKDNQHKKKNKYSARNKKRFNLKNKTLKSSRRKKGGARGYKPRVDSIAEEQQNDVDEESQDAPQQQEEPMGEQGRTETPIVEQASIEEPVVLERPNDVAKPSTSRFGKLFRRQDDTQGEKPKGFISSIKNRFGKKTLQQEQPIIEQPIIEQPIVEQPIVEQQMEPSNEATPITPSMCESPPTDNVETIERKIDEYNRKINELNLRKDIIEAEIQEAKDAIVSSKQKKDQETSDEELISLNKIIDENNEILNKKQEAFEIILNDIENANKELKKEEYNLKIIWSCLASDKEQATQAQAPELPLQPATPVIQKQAPELPLQPATQTQVQTQSQSPQVIQEEEAKQPEEEGEEKTISTPKTVEDVYTTMTTDEDEFYKTIKVIIKIPRKSNVNIINNAVDSVDSYLQQIA